MGGNELFENKYIHSITRINNGIITIISLILFFYPFIMGIIGVPPALVFRPTYLAFLFLLGVMCLPTKIFKLKSIGEYIINLLLLIGVASCIWVSSSWMSFLLTFNMTQIELLLGICLILAAMELTRRTPVKSLNYVAIIAFIYALFGNYLPGLFGHAGMTLTRLVRTQLFTTDGLFGTPIAIGATYIGLIVFFSAFLEASGGSEKFMKFTIALAGRYNGGPAKVAVVASGLMGMISGSAVTNVVTTGVITIPMMKRVGYKPSFAAGVESTASLGSQLAPPILGATAFLICELTGESFLKIMSISIIPCLLYYFCVFMQVHFSSIKQGIKGIPVKDLPNLGTASKEVIPFAIPIVLLIILLIMHYSTEYCISMSIVMFFIVSFINKETRPKIIKNFITGVKSGAKSLLALISSLAIAGLIIGILTMSGLGDKLSYLIEILSMGNFHFLIFFTALICMVLGMGMVTIGAYILVATLTAPLLVEFGIPLLAAHFFIFYYAVMSAISPPVMVGVFAATSIADSRPIPTAGYALRLAIAGFIAPILFIYNPEMLFLDGFSWEGVLYISTAIIGLGSLCMAFERYSFFSRLSIVKCFLFAFVGLLTMWPNIILSILGIIGFIILIMSEYINKNSASNYYVKQ